MLGQITRALSEIYTRLDSRPFVAEAKLDGQRGQIHVSTTAPTGEQGSWYEPLPGTDGQRIWVRVFSRHLLEMTDKYPDIAYTLSVSSEVAQCGSGGGLGLTLSSTVSRASRIADRPAHHRLYHRLRDCCDRPRHRQFQDVPGAELPQSKRCGNGRHQSARWDLRIRLDVFEWTGAGL